MYFVLGDATVARLGKSCLTELRDRIARLKLLTDLDGEKLLGDNWADHLICERRICLLV